jgi:hypothetical protein
MGTLSTIELIIPGTQTNNVIETNKCIDFGNISIKISIKYPM